MKFNLVEEINYDHTDYDFVIVDASDCMRRILKRIKRMYIGAIHRMESDKELEQRATREFNTFIQLYLAGEAKTFVSRVLLSVTTPEDTDNKYHD